MASALSGLALGTLGLGFRFQGPPEVARLAVLAVYFRGDLFGTVRAPTSLEKGLGTRDGVGCCVMFSVASLMNCMTVVGGSTVQEHQGTQHWHDFMQCS